MIMDKYQEHEIIYSELKSKTMTNADAIRNMTDEELTGFIFSSCTEFIECDQKYRCEECISKWLKSEVSE